MTPYMTTKPRLTYPAPNQGKFHTDRKKQNSRDYFNAVFGSSFMRGPFTAISRHGITPLILGALVTATGHSYMLIRGLGVIISAVWFSVDIGVWLSEKKREWPYKFSTFCTCFPVLCCLAMGIMHWFLSSTLEDQQADVYAHLNSHITNAPDGDIMHTVFTVTNDSGSRLGKHKLACGTITIIANNGASRMGRGFVLSMSASSDVPIESGGDAVSATCLGGLDFTSVECVDFYLMFDYVLENQPGEQKTKYFRFSGSGPAIYRAGDRFKWAPVSINEPKSYCEKGQ
jgi:hypothetical protein